MPEFTLVKNQFQPEKGRELLNAFEGESLKQITKRYQISSDHVITINGKEINDLEYQVRKEDSILIMQKVAGGGGGDKNIWRTIALVVVYVVATVLSQGTLAGTYSFLPSSFASGGWALGAAVAIGGSMLINAVLPPQTPDYTGGGGLSESNTYGWAPSRNKLGEGEPIPILYGSHRVTPQIISRRRYPTGTTEKIILVMAICQGLIQEVTDIKMNGDSNVEYTSSIRLGENTQTPLFSELSDEESEYGKVTKTSNEKVINLPLPEDDEYLYFQSNGNSADALTVSFIFPRGLFNINDEGKYIEAVALIGLEYRKIGSSIWLDVPESFYELETTRFDHNLNQSVTNIERHSDYRVLVIKGSNPYPVRYAVTVNIIDPGQYEFRTRQNKKNDNVRYIDDCYVDYLNEVISDKFSYPGISLLGIASVASERLNGVAPQISCVAKRNTVVVNGNNKPATNPAWACYDLITNQLYGAKVDESRMRLSEFQAWADFCDDQNLTVNIYIDSLQSLHEALNLISLNGRGSVVQRGTEFGAVWDGISSRVQLFTVGNIVKDSIRINYLESESRANQIEVTYFDEEQDFQRKVISIRDDESPLSEDTKSASIVLTGCTNSDQATRHAKYQLNANQYLRRTIEFEADIDAIACVVGDVIDVQHDLPKWGYGGRVVSSTASTITLDRPVEVDPTKNYQVIIRQDDDQIIEKDIDISTITENSELTTLNLVEDFVTIPVQGNVYSFGEINKLIKKFRVISVGRSKNMLVKITALEYREEIYDDNLEVPDYEQESDLILGAESLRLDDIFQVLPDGTIAAKIAVSWRGDAAQYSVTVKDKITDDFREFYTGNKEYLIGDVDIGSTYVVSVHAVGTNSQAISGEITIQIDPPGKVQQLRSEIIDNFVLLKWSPPIEEFPISHYDVYKGETFDSAEFIGRADKTFTSFFEVIAGDYRYWVQAIDGGGRKGEPCPIDVTLDLQDDFKALNELFLKGNYEDKENSVFAECKIVGSIDEDQTWEQWWDDTYLDNTNISWQNFIDDGYEVYPTPDPSTTFFYEEIIDLETTYTNEITIKVSEEIEVLYGNASNASVSKEIFYGADQNNLNPTSKTNQITVSNIRYLKLRYEGQTGGSLITIKPKVEVIAKKKEETGSFDIADANNGVFVNFRESFADVESILITPKGTSSITAVYDFNDIPNPTGFTAKFFDSNGTPVIGGGSFIAKGV